MKMSFKFVAIALLGLSGVALADEAVGAKAKVIKNDASRGAKKAAHRVEEAVCTKSDAECLARKAKNRTTETAEAVEDKASEIKGKHSK
jgi:hypothetical protein